MLRVGRNEIDGVPVEVLRKRIRRINLRVAQNGLLRLSIPYFDATLAQGEAFLKAKWAWAVKARLPGWKDLRKRLNGRDWEGRFRTL